MREGGACEGVLLASRAFKTAGFARNPGCLSSPATTFSSPHTRENKWRTVLGSVDIRVIDKDKEVKCQRSTTQHVVYTHPKICRRKSWLYIRSRSVVRAARASIPPPVPPAVL